MNNPGQNGSAETCTAIVLKLDADVSNDNKQTIKPTSGFSEARSMLESKFGGKFSSNKYRIKEKNLVIKVKKNMNEEELEKDNKTETSKDNMDLKITANSDTNNGYNQEGMTIMKPKEIKPKNKGEGGDDHNEYRCNIKEDTQDSLKKKRERIIDDIENYEEESNNNDNGFMEPLF